MNDQLPPLSGPFDDVCPPSFEEVEHAETTSSLREATEGVHELGHVAVLGYN